MSKNLVLKKTKIQKMQDLVSKESIYNINYSEFGLDKKETEELIQCEVEIDFHKQKTVEHILKYSKAIYIANQIFARKNTGKFGKWIEKLNIHRDTANIAIRRYQLFLEMKKNNQIEDSNKILTLPNRTIKALTGQKKNKFEDDEVIEIINSDNPTSKLKEVEEEKEKIKFEDKSEYMIFLKQEKVRKQKMVKKLKEEIELIELEIQKL